jgi:hypothetical protein
MTKEEIGKQIEALRKECGVSTYELEQKGIHPSLPATIEKGQKGYSMDSLIKYLKAIDEDIFLSVRKSTKKRKKMQGGISKKSTNPPKKNHDANMFYNI